MHMSNILRDSGEIPLSFQREFWATSLNDVSEMLGSVSHGAA